MRRAALAFVLTLATTASAAETLPWIRDDYKQAVARAAKEKKPIFVEAWAPW